MFKVYKFVFLLHWISLFNGAYSQNNSISTIWYSQEDLASLGSTLSYVVTSQELSWWEAAASGCSQVQGYMLTPGVTTLEGHVTDLETVTEAGKRYWVGAAKTSRPWTWSDGSPLLECREGLLKHDFRRSFVIPDNEAYSCFIQCNFAPVALQGDLCICLTRVGTGFIQSSCDVSNGTRCPGNFNETCGNDQTPSVYDMNTAFRLTVPNAEMTGECAHVSIQRFVVTNFNIRCVSSCDMELPFFLQDPTNATLIRPGQNVTSWRGAWQEARGAGLQLLAGSGGFDATLTEETLERELLPHWVGLSRTRPLLWLDGTPYRDLEVGESPGPRVCVSAYLCGQQLCYVEEACDTPRPALCVARADVTDATAAALQSWSTTSTVIVCVVLAVVLVIAIVIAVYCYFRRKRRGSDRSSLVRGKQADTVSTSFKATEDNTPIRINSTYFQVNAGGLKGGNAVSETPIYSAEKPPKQGSKFTENGSHARPGRFGQSAGSIDGGVSVKPKLVQPPGEEDYDFLFDRKKTALEGQQGQTNYEHLALPGKTGEKEAPAESQATFVYETAAPLPSEQPEDVYCTMKNKSTRRREKGKNSKDGDMSSSSPSAAVDPPLSIPTISTLPSFTPLPPLPPAPNPTHPNPTGPVPYGAQSLGAPRLLESQENYYSMVRESQIAPNPSTLASPSGRPLPDPTARASPAAVPPTPPPTPVSPAKPMGVSSNDDAEPDYAKVIPRSKTKTNSGFTTPAPFAPARFDVRASTLGAIGNDDRSVSSHSSSPDLGNPGLARQEEDTSSVPGSRRSQSLGAALDQADEEDVDPTTFPMEICPFEVMDPGAQPVASEEIGPRPSSSQDKVSGLPPLPTPTQSPKLTSRDHSHGSMPSSPGGGSRPSSPLSTSPTSSRRAGSPKFPPNRSQRGSPLLPSRAPGLSQSAPSSPQFDPRAKGSSMTLPSQGGQAHLPGGHPGARLPLGVRSGPVMNKASTLRSSGKRYARGPPAPSEPPPLPPTNRNPSPLSASTTSLNKTPSSKLAASSMPLLYTQPVGPRHQPSSVTPSHSSSSLGSPSISSRMTEDRRSAAVVSALYSSLQDEDTYASPYDAHRPTCSGEIVYAAPSDSSGRDIPRHMTGAANEKEIGRSQVSLATGTAQMTSDVRAKFLPQPSFKYAVPKPNPQPVEPGGFQDYSEID